MFDSAYNINWHTFKKEFYQILWLAGPGVIVSTLLTAVVLMYCIGYGDVFTWSSALMLGSVLAATDPVAVVALLKEVGASRKLATLIEGESLLNDGTAMVLFTGMFGYATGDSISFNDLAILFFRLTVGGPLLGILFGIVLCFYLKRIFHDDIIEFTLILTASYIVFYIAEETAVKVSGILSLVSLGLYMSAWGKYHIKVYSKEAVHHVWSYAAYASETMIFTLSGILIGYNAYSFDVTGIDYLKCVWFYVCIYGIRVIQLLFSYPILKYLAYGVSWRDAAIIVHGGMLRCALGLILALIISMEGNLDSRTRAISLFLMSGIAVLTLLINGSTTAFVLNRLGLTKTTIHQETLLKEVLSKLEKETDFKIEQLKLDRYQRGSEWGKVKELSGLTDFFSNVISSTTGGKAVLKEIKRTKGDLHNFKELFLQTLHPKDTILLEKEYRRRFIQTLKRFYLHYFEQGKCSQKTIQTLIESSERALDYDEQPLNDWKYIKHSMRTDLKTRLLKKLRCLPFLNDVILRREYFNLAYSFDLTSTFIYCHSYTSDTLKDIMQPEQRNTLQKIFAESKTERKKCKKFIKKNIKCLFGEILLDLQTKRAAHAVLNHQREVVNQLYSDGVISDKEYNIMCIPIEERMYDLQSKQQTQAYPSLRSLIQNSSLFKFFSLEITEKLILNSKTVVYKQGDTIHNLYNPIPGVHILLRGKILEQTLTGDSYIHEQGDILGLHTYLTDLDLSDTYSTALNTVYATYIPKSSIKDALRNNIVQETLWKYCIPILVALYPNEFVGITSSLSSNSLKKFLSVCRFKRYDKGNCVQLETGAFVIQGQICYVDQGGCQNKYEERKDSKEVELENMNLGVRYEGYHYNACCYMLPSPFSSILCSKDNTILLHFGYKLYEIMQNQECSLERAIDILSSKKSTKGSFEKLLGKKSFSINGVDLEEEKQQESEILSF